MFRCTSRQIALILTVSLPFGAGLRAQEKGVLEFQGTANSEWLGAYLLAEGHPQATVVAQLERGTVVQVDSTRGNDQYCFVRVPGKPESTGSGYVWRPFITLVGVVNGRSPRQSPSGDRSGEVKAAVLEQSRAFSLSTRTDSMRDGLRSDPEPTKTREGPGPSEKTNGQANQVLIKMTETLDAHMKILNRLSQDISVSRTALEGRLRQNQTDIEIRMKSRFDLMERRIESMGQRASARVSPVGSEVRRTRRVQPTGQTQQTSKGTSKLQSAQQTASRQTVSESPNRIESELYLGGKRRFFLPKESIPRVKRVLGDLVNRIRATDPRPS